MMVKVYVERDSVMRHMTFCRMSDQVTGVVRTKDILSVPAADVVEVVRCKDCEFYKNGCCFSPYIGCGYVNPQMTPNDFCSHARRSNDGTA